MTLKKEIMESLKEESATVKINGVSYLHRWTKTALGDNVDKLQITFEYICGVKGGWRKEIEARDYDGIIAEIEEATKEYMTMCADQMAKNMKAGYR